MKPESSSASFLSSSFRCASSTLASPPWDGDRLEQKRGAVCRPGRVPRPNSKSAMRLPPLENEATRSPAVGASHLATVRSLRRSQSLTTGPSALAAPRAGWGRPGDQTGEEGGREGRPSPQTLRRERRPRRSMDICSEAGKGSGSNHCGVTSPASPAAASGVTKELTMQEAREEVAASPTPEIAPAQPAFTEDAARAKARAVAMLQKLFFEELANGSGQDANSAAVAALRRLTEGSLGNSTRPTSPSPAQEQKAPSPAPEALPRKPLMASGDGPRRPAPMVGRPGQKVKVQS